MKLYDQIPIEDWKKIAYAVQRLDISDGSEEEFDKNLKKLQQLLLNRDDLNISVATLNWNPKREEEIGLATLLQAVYDGNCCTYYKKAYMYEKIQMLDELGVKNISFNPVAFNYMNIPSAFSCHYQGISNIGYAIHRCYTNGNFTLKSNIDNPTEYYYDVDMQDLQNAEYVLTSIIALNSNDNNKIEQNHSDAIIKNFNGEYPSKAEIWQSHTPRIKVSRQYMHAYNSPSMDEDFYLSTFQSEDLSCRKRLTRTKSGQYYYKEYKDR